MINFFAENPALNFATVMICITCSSLYCFTATQYWKVKYNRISFCFIGGSLMGITLWSGIFLHNEIAFYVILACLEMLLLKVFTHITFIQAIFASVSSTLHTMCLKGIVSGIISLIFMKNLYQVLSIPLSAIIILIITMICKSAVLLIYKNTNTRKKLLVLFNAENELSLVVYQHCSLFIFMLFYSYNYYYNLDLIWFSFAQMLLSTLILVLFVLILYYGMRVSNLVENDILNKEIQVQLVSQSSNYNSYKTLFTTVQQQQQHLHEFLLSTEQLLDNNKIDDVRDLIITNKDSLFFTLPLSVSFSNNTKVDALLLDWKNISDHYNIDFKAFVSISESISDKETDILKILLLTKSLALPVAQYSENSAICITAKSTNTFWAFNIRCTFCGTIESKSGLPYFITPKSDEIKSNYHRLNSTVMGYNGTILWSTTGNQFKISISL